MATCWSLATVNHCVGPNVFPVDPSSREDLWIPGLGSVSVFASVSLFSFAKGQSPSPLLLSFSLPLRLQRGPFLLFVPVEEEAEEQRSEEEGCRG